MTELNRFVSTYVPVRIPRDVDNHAAADDAGAPPGRESGKDGWRLDRVDIGGVVPRRRGVVGADEDRDIAGDAADDGGASEIKVQRAYRSGINVFAVVKITALQDGANTV